MSILKLLAMTRPSRPRTGNRGGMKAHPAPVWLSEVEGQARRGCLEGCSTDGIVGGIAAADLIAMSAGAETVVPTLPLREFAGDDVPTGPFAEVVTEADRILIGGILEQVSLNGRRRRQCRRIDAQCGGVAGRVGGVRI